MNHLTKNVKFVENISNLFKKKIIKFAQKVNEEFPLIYANAMLAIWCKQQEIPFSTFDEMEASDFDLTPVPREKREE
jgi:hypothetical protein